MQILCRFQAYEKVGRSGFGASAWGGGEDWGLHGPTHYCVQLLGRKRDMFRVTPNRWFQLAGGVAISQLQTLVMLGSVSEPHPMSVTSVVSPQVRIPR